VFSTVFVLTTYLSISSLTIYLKLMSFRVPLPPVRFSRSPQPKSYLIFLFLFFLGLSRAVPTKIKYRRLPVRSFAKNQLSPGTISISHLTTSHRRILQHSPVRSLFNTNLDIVRSPGFHGYQNLSCH
jgi:hypothetical protein